MLCVFFTPADKLWFVGLSATILSSYFIRICDDICDFSKDKQSNKIVLNQKTLILIAFGITFCFITIAIITKLYLLLLPLIIISSQFLLKEKCRNFIKPIFIPIILISLFNTVFAFSLWVLVIMVIFIILDIILIFGGKSNDSH